LPYVGHDNKEASDSDSEDESSQDIFGGHEKDSQRGSFVGKRQLIVENADTTRDEKVGLSKHVLVEDITNKVQSVPGDWESTVI